MRCQCALRLLPSLCDGPHVNIRARFFRRLFSVNFLTGPAGVCVGPAGLCAGPAGLCVGLAGLCFGPARAGGAVSPGASVFAAKQPSLGIAGQVGSAEHVAHRKEAQWSPTRATVKLRQATATPAMAMPAASSLVAQATGGTTAMSTNHIADSASQRLQRNTSSNNSTALSVPSSARVGQPTAAPLHSAAFLARNFVPLMETALRKVAQPSSVGSTRGSSSSWMWSHWWQSRRTQSWGVHGRNRVVARVCGGMGEALLPAHAARSAKLRAVCAGAAADGGAAVTFEPDSAATAAATADAVGNGSVSAASHLSDVCMDRSASVPVATEASHHGAATEGEGVRHGNQEEEDSRGEREGEASEEGQMEHSGGIRTFPIGAFQQLPSVSPASEIITTALRRARLVRPTKGIVNMAKRERNKGTKQLDTLTKELAGPLATYVRGFPRVQRLHPFERDVLTLTLGHGTYEETLGGVDALRKRILDVGKSYAALVNKTTTKKEATEQTEKAFVQLEQLYLKRCHIVDSLKELTKTLRKMPVVRHDIPTLCLVGAPNVGKSSLVRVISSGKPEVCNYPFTTRGISMGHFFVGTKRHQVTDTPGLLARPDEQRNSIELLTVAALSHLPTSVLFVHDLTEECGMSVEDQLKLYTEMKARFSHKPWLDVVSKCDLLPQQHAPLAAEHTAPSSTSSVPTRAGDSSASSSTGSSHSGSSSNGDSSSGSSGRLKPEAFATEVSVEEYRAHGPPGAVRVSTTTEEGLEELVKRVVELLSHSNDDGRYDDSDDGLDEVEGDPASWRTPLATKKTTAQSFYYPALGDGSVV